MDNPKNRQFSLAYLTVPGSTPPEQTYIASRAGYDMVSLRLINMGVPGEPDCEPTSPEIMRATKAALRETGLAVLDIELARILPDNDPKTYLPAFEAGAELGARHVISSAWTGTYSDRNFIVDRYAQLCDLAAPFGLTVDLEYPTFSRLSSLREAADIVHTAGRSNGGILVDTLYFYFSGCSLDDLAIMPRSWFHFLHICDTDRSVPVTREGKIKIARDDRAYVGEGWINVREIVARLPEVPFSIELPNSERTAELGKEGHARRCLETAKAYFENPESAAPPHAAEMPRRAASAR
jgi:sugar phosphate isomerase/epimerase